MDKENNSKTIYLDNAATTFPKPESVYTEMDYVNRNLAVNTGRGSYSLRRYAPYWPVLYLSGYSQRI